MRPIISIVGKSKSGKTTLLEGLVAGLQARGYKLAVIKHAGETLELDLSGKDSWRLSEVTRGAVIISAPRQVAIFRPMEHDPGPMELARLVDDDCDLILTEGFKQAATLKIEVHRREQGSDLVSSAKQLLAVVTDEPLGVDVPQFSPEDIVALVELVEGWLVPQLDRDEVELAVNGLAVALNPFVGDIIARTVAAMVTGLKGVDEPGTLRLVLKKGRKSGLPTAKGE